MKPPADLLVVNVSRRRFLQSLSLGGLVLAVGRPSTAQAQEAKKYGADGMPNGWVDNPLAFVSIAADGTVTIVCHRSEMGQGVRTGMPMIVADELEADWKRVRVVQAPGDEKKFGNQDTDGSRSTRHFFEPMRRCGAAARTMLEAAAAERWKVPPSEVEARNHEVVHRPTGRRLGPTRLPRPGAPRAGADQVERPRHPARLRGRPDLRDRLPPRPGRRCGRRLRHRMARQQPPLRPPRLLGDRGMAHLAGSGDGERRRDARPTGPT